MDVGNLSIWEAEAEFCHQFEMHLGRIVSFWLT